jgi:uncharacterized protein
MILMSVISPLHRQFADPLTGGHMRHIHTILLMTLVSGAAPMGLAAQQAPESVRTPVIVSSAHGMVRAASDRAIIVLAVQTRATTAAAAATENAAKQTAVLAALRSAGVRDSQISTENYAITPETRYDKDGQAPHIVSYLVTNSIAVRVEASSDLGRFIDTALSAGANQVSSIEFSASDTQSLYQRALSIAVQNAKAQAEVMARSAGGHLGPLVEISSTDGGWIPPTPREMRGMAIAAAAVQTPIVPGPETVSASVTGRWTFVPDP